MSHRLDITESLICLADEVAGVYCVATIQEERGKGLGSHATAEPLRLVGKPFRSSQRLAHLRCAPHFQPRRQPSARRRWSFLG
jgi:hypothetical protein